MNTSVLRTLGFWLSLVTALTGVALGSGLVLEGSQVDHIIGWLITVIGVFTGHSVALPKTDAPAN